MDIGSFASIEYIGFRGVRFSVANVIHDGCVEQNGILRDDTDVFPKTEECEITDIMSINGDRSAVNIVESE